MAAQHLDVEYVKPTCRSVKGNLYAFYEACDKLREAYMQRCMQEGGSLVTFKITLLVEDRHVPAQLQPEGDDGPLER